MKSRGEALRDYVIRRLLLMIPTFLGITFLTFLLIQFVPGGQIDQLRMTPAGAGAGGEVAAGGDARVQFDIPDEQLARLREYYGFDRPFLLAYGEWLWNALRLDLGCALRARLVYWDYVRWPEFYLPRRHATLSVTDYPVCWIDPDARRELEAAMREGQAYQVDPEIDRDPWGVVERSDG